MVGRQGAGVSLGAPAKETSKEGEDLTCSLVSDFVLETSSHEPLPTLGGYFFWVLGVKETSWFCEGGCVHSGSPLFLCGYTIIISSTAVRTCVL